MARNIILLVTDTLRVARTQDGQIETPLPRLTQRLGPKGHFLPLVSSSSWTVPSHGVLLRGGDPWDYAAPWAGRDSCANGRSLAGAWKELGGTALALAANPVIVSNPGLTRGFDLESAGVEQPVVRMGVHYFDRIDHRYRAAWQSGEDAGPPALSGQPAPSADRAMIARVARAVASPLKRRMSADVLDSRLRAVLRGAARSQPLLLFVNLMEAHEPYPFPDEGNGRSEYHGLNLPTFNLGYHFDHGSNWGRADPRSLRQAYWHWADQLDQGILRVLDVLESTGALSDCLLVVVSDHGQDLGEHSFVGHGRYLHDELTEIPCWIYDSHGEGVEAPPAPNLLSADHRVLHDLLERSIESGESGRALKQLTQRLRDPGQAAVSYCDRLTPRARARDKKFQYYQQLRVRIGSGSVEYRRHHPVGSWEQTAMQVAPNEEAGLLSEAERLLRDVPWLPGTPGSSPSDVDVRLRSWGY
ncbi:MAG: sulfatase-like hydrolase/transferase [Thermoplasmata archaeon]